MNKSAALIFLTVLAVGRPDAATILGMDIDQVAGDAELIFEGRVIRHQTGEDADTKIISTYVTFIRTGRAERRFKRRFHRT